MTDWLPIKFPLAAQPGDYLRVDGDRFIRVDTAKNFQTAEELKTYIEQVTKDNLERYTEGKP